MSTRLKTIPLCQLRRSKDNIRKTDRLADIEQMARSIEANGLLENLVVEPAASTKSKPTVYDVVAGGRRLAGLKLLAKRKKIGREHPVPCLVLQNGTTGVEASLAENFIRVPVHPADQCEAFATLSQDGLSPAEISARFGVSLTFVEQRLKLAAISPKLLAEYRAGAMTLEQLTAFTLCDDHQLQEEVWFERTYADLPAHLIRRLLTKAQVEGSDRRARFVGASAYEAAGGVIVRDLFDADDEGYFSDSQLLDRLVAEKLEEAAAAVRQEGWSWVELYPEADYSLLSRYGRAPTAEVSLSEAEEESLSRLAERYDKLSASLEQSEEGDTTELDRISSEMERLQAKKETWSEEAKNAAGAILSLGQSGELQVIRGLIIKDENNGLDGKLKTDGKTRTPRSNGYSESVLRDLSVHRTAALRELLSGNPEVALLALLHAVTDTLFYRGGSHTCLRIVAQPVTLEERDGTEANQAAETFQSRHAQWLERLPDRSDLWTWLSERDSTERSALLAHCVALTVDALRGASEDQRIQADRLAMALGLDMRQWWRPTKTGFLAKLTKNEILAAVSEGVSTQASWRLAGLKKERMAKEAEKLLAETSWLPVPLRSAPDQLQNTQSQ